MKDDSKLYSIEYKEQFIEDILQHKKSGNKVILSKIELLIEEIEIHPRTGTGKPEPLRGNRKGLTTPQFRLYHGTQKIDEIVVRNPNLLGTANVYLQAW